MTNSDKSNNDKLAGKGKCPTMLRRSVGHCFLLTKSASLYEYKRSPGKIIRAPFALSQYPPCLVHDLRRGLEHQRIVEHAEPALLVQQRVRRSQRLHQLGVALQVENEGRV